MTAINLDLIERAFGKLVDCAIWASADYPNSKAPLNAKTGHFASHSDPATWSTLGEVLSFNRKRFNGGGAIGIMAGPHPILNPERVANRPHITLFDLDNGIRGDLAMDWARPALHTFQGETYMELSGSGTGVHSVGVVDALPVDYLGLNQWGRKVELPEAEKADPNGKTPGIEIYCDKRFMLVSTKPFGLLVPVRNVTGRIPLILPRRLDSGDLPSTAILPPSSDPDGDITDLDIESAYRTGLTLAERNHLDGLLTRHEDLREAMLGDKWLDRSAALFASADLAKGYGLTLGQYVSALMASTGSAAQHVNDQKHPMRSIARAWNRSPQPEALVAVPPADPEQEVGYLADDVRLINHTSTMLDLLTETNPLGPVDTVPKGLMTLELPESRFILSDFMPAGPVLLAGAGGQGKSTLAIALAVMGLLGMRVWGREWQNLGRVVYCTKEDEKSEVILRLQRILRGLNVSNRQSDELIHNRFLIETLTGANSTLAVAERNGQINPTDLPDMLVDKYRNLDVGLMIFDPLNQFGPGEVHGNDGAAAVMRIGWSLARQLRGDPDVPVKELQAKSTVLFISHMSMAAARDEVDDIHAGRSAAALGDNARSVYVLHRHKIDNPNGYVAPSTISQEAVENGDVMRLKVAKQSYAKLPLEPFYIERSGWSFNLHMPLSGEEARAARLIAPTPAKARSNAEFEAQKAQLRGWMCTRTSVFSKEDAINFVNTLPGTKGPIRAAVPGMLQALIDEKKLRKETIGERYSAIRPDMCF